MSEPLRGPDDAAGDLAAIGDQQSFKHLAAFPGWRSLFEKGLRDLRGPRARRAAPRSAGPSRAPSSSSIARAWQKETRDLASACAPGAQRNNASTIFSRKAGASSSLADLMNETDLARGPRENNFGGQGIAPRLTRADRPDDKRSDHRGNDPELHLAQAKARAFGRDRDVATGDETDAAAIGRAVNKAMVGFDRRSSPCINSASAIASARFSSNEAAAMRFIQSMSPPAQKLGPSPADKDDANVGSRVQLAQARPLDARPIVRRKRCGARGGSASASRRRDRRSIPIDPSLRAHMRNSPNRVSSMGAFALAERQSPSTRRVSTGSITPSSQSRALE